MSVTTLSLSDLAMVAMEDFRRGRGDLAGIIELALLTAVRDERRACVAECTRRAELWEKTGDAPDTSAPLRDEARGRAAEARYLGDLLATRR